MSAVHIKAEPEVSKAMIASAIDMLDRARPTSRTDRWGALVQETVLARPVYFVALIDGILISAVRAGDLETLVQALTLRANTGQPSTWILGRVAGYLERFALAEPDRISPILGQAGLDALASAEVAIERLRSQDHLT